MSLDVASLMAGAKERGELEDRVTKLIKEIIKSGKYILTKKLCVTHYKRIVFSSLIFLKCR
jgi:hypothetical protein